MESGTLIAVALLTGSQSPGIVSIIAKDSIDQSIPYRKFSAVYNNMTIQSMLPGRIHIHSVNTYLGNSLAVQSKHNPTHWLVTMFDVKVDLSGMKDQYKRPIEISRI